MKGDRLLILCLLLIAGIAHSGFGQSDLLSQLQSDAAKETVEIEATFKSTRLINGHTVETRDAKDTSMDLGATKTLLQRVQPMARTGFGTK